jgi:hypothetical protein
MPTSSAVLSQRLEELCLLLLYACSETSLTATWVVFVRGSGPSETPWFSLRWVDLRGLGLFRMARLRVTTSDTLVGTFTLRESCWCRRSLHEPHHHQQCHYAPLHAFTSFTQRW